MNDLSLQPNDLSQLIVTVLIDSAVIDQIALRVITACHNAKKSRLLHKKLKTRD